MSRGEAVEAVLLVVFAYLMGSLSPSVFLGKLCRGLDVREHGSGNAGTTNAFRVLGARLGIAVLVGDILKGVVPVVIAKEISTPLVTVLVALACVLGHNYSVFLRGKGGKGVATGAGVALGMMPLPMAILVAVFVLLLLLTRIVSVASIVCAVLLPVFALLFHRPREYVIVFCVLAVVVVCAHHGNFVRLWRHEEPKIRLPWAKAGTEGQTAELDPSSSEEAREEVAP